MQTQCHMTNDTLTEAERQLLRPVLARYAQWESAHDGPVFEAVERILTARLAAAREQTKAEALAPIRALADEACENYSDPLNPDSAQDCITAGPEVFAVEACCRCRVRAALPAEPEENNR